MIHMIAVFGGTCPEAFYKKDVLKYFAKFTVNHLSRNLFLIKVQAFNLKLYSKRDTDAGVYL